jgi:hypothetical protein
MVFQYVTTLEELLETIKNLVVYITCKNMLLKLKNNQVRYTFLDIKQFVVKVLINTVKKNQQFNLQIFL